MEGHPEPVSPQRKAAVADVLRNHAPAYLLRHDVPQHQCRVVQQLMQCRTRELGGQLWGCGACGTRRYRYHSCRHSHCPTCSVKPRADWLDTMLEKRLPIPYAHVVFTLPHELNPLVEAEPRSLYHLLFEVVWQVMERYALEQHGLKITAVLVLHTWGQRLNAHPHVHCLLALGGLSAAGRWVGSADPHALIGATTLADRFRQLFLKRLRLSANHGEIRLPPALDYLQSRENRLATRRWIVHIDSPPADVSVR